MAHKWIGRERPADYRPSRRYPPPPTCTADEGGRGVISAHMTISFNFPAGGRCQRRYATAPAKICRKYGHAGIFFFLAFLSISGYRYHFSWILFSRFARSFANLWYQIISHKFTVQLINSIK